MTWARLKVTDCAGAVLRNPAGHAQERLFNLEQLQWWIGHGSRVELQYASQPPVFVDISDKGMELLTGSTGGYANGT